MSSDRACPAVSAEDPVLPARRRPRVRTWLWIALGACITVLAAVPASVEAHSGVESYLYLDLTDDELGGRVEMPFGDVRTVFGYALDLSDPAGAQRELEANVAEIEAYVREHMSVGAAGQRWDYEATGVRLLQAEGGYVVLDFLADVPGAVPRDLEVSFDPFFDEIEERTALLLIGNDWAGGVIDNGEEVLIGFDASVRERQIDLGDASQWKNFDTSVGLGVDHIRTGPDHILFVLVLLLPSVLVFAAGSWHPVTTFGASLWRILKIVSMFTIAHSITFVLAGLEVLPLPPSRLVESVIAASIIATALHNLHPVVVNREWVIAFVFGLFHGMGFASLVSGLDVSQTTKMVSLLGRNVGIEIGQAVVVLLLFPGLFLLRRTRWYRPVFVLASLGLALVAFGWMLERIFEVDLKVGRIVEPIIEFPRSLVLVAVFTSVALIVNRIETRANRLLPTYDMIGAYGVEHEDRVPVGTSAGAP